MLLAQLTAESSPLTNEQITKLQGLVAELNPIQQAWVSGYLAANAQLAGGQMPMLASQPQAGDTLTILYGSQTGNAKGIAQALADSARSQGLAVKLTSMADFKPQQLKKETHLVILVSTHGEGDAPDDAEILHQFLASKKAPKLDKLKYSVLALGDSSYELFCQTGKDFDERLAALGAQAVIPRQDCDVEYEDDAKTWSEAVIKTFEEEVKESSNESTSQVIPMPGVATPASAAAQTFTKQNPFTATLVANQKITGRNSTKDVRHIEIDLADSGIQYQVGDALGVYFENDDAIVTELLALLSINEHDEVNVGEHSLTIKVALKEALELTLLHPGFVKKYAELINHEALTHIASDGAGLRDYIATRQVIDVVREYPDTVSAADFAGILRKLTPRLYSIASSQAETEEEVHLTLGLVEYDAFGHVHQGGASGFLAKRLEEGGDVKVYVEPNNNFRLPANSDTPVIMIGPGTGIAPFRAFLQQRDADEAAGKNWLFFGNPHFTQDFLYQTELQGYKKQGLLTRLDVAFSRDQAEKVYVQDRLIAQGQAVFEWLEQGAHIYVCGDASRMAKDVHHALIEIIKQHGAKDQEQAEAYLTELRAQKRYQKDVY
ncbi:assimilatory sulfite reductase (NADPH) flavoprotein subunit [Flocculibacter collagenilyticus]|uniref:assimilatory sulfite reductase (NADPH) flavoprotein subunit n=1 Tax=Flocculibacter collagenilyticus TaxID=2744479 RepID=UPI0018F286CC|nr:assimilatory sulfite reductase (NADPH) flavoprotein subunit [Flocculibacter collagenilyticus]